MFSVGVQLTPIIEPIKRLGLEGIRGRVFAVDALNVIYQFLALIRLHSGMPLTDKEGRVTSHLVGLSTRFTRLMYEYGCDFIFVFDGPPHPLKMREIERRRRIRETARARWQEALEKGDYREAFSKAVSATSVDDEVIASARRLLELMGLPVIDAPHDAEAQAAYIVSRGEAWAVNTIDWDALLYGAPRMVRYITLTGSEWLPSRGVARRLEPELIVLEEVLRRLGITREQLVEVAILVGTDYNQGVPGIGPRRALKLIKRYGSIENLPPSIRGKVGDEWVEVKEIFLNPPVHTEYRITFSEPRYDELYEFLVIEHDFSPKRVSMIIERLRRINERRKQRRILDYMGEGV